MEALSYTNRYEIKYLVQTQQVPEIHEALDPFLELDRNGFHDGGYYCQSIYFDSPDRRFYREKTEGDLTRIKPRIRAYRPSPEAPTAAVFMELKGRYDRIIAKRRSAIDESQADLLLTRSSDRIQVDSLATSALDEFNYLANRFQLAPSVSVLYHRTPYFGSFYPNVRVTFDRNIRCSLVTALDAEFEDFYNAIPSNWLVMELKYSDKVPGMLLDRIRALGLRQWSFSKFAVSTQACFDVLRTRRVLH